MILYATKQTTERYNLKMPNELSDTTQKIVNKIIAEQKGDRLLEWGVKLFYFDKRKCIQVVNFASKFTLFLVDIKVNDIKDIGHIIASYLFELYKNDKDMTFALNNTLSQDMGMCFGKLVDKSAIATLNTTQLKFLDDGYGLYEFIENGILKTKEVNYMVNFRYLFTLKKDNKTEYIYAGEEFREQIIKRYSKV